VEARQKSSSSSVDMELSENFSTESIPSEVLSLFSSSLPSSTWDYDLFMKTFELKDTNKASSFESNIGTDFIKSSQSEAFSQDNQKTASDLNIERFFKQTDAILELDAPRNLKRILQINSNASIDDVVKRAASSYVGISHMNRILSEFIILAKSLGNYENYASKLSVNSESEQNEVITEMYSSCKVESDKQILVELANVLESQARFDPESEKKVHLSTEDEAWLLNILKFPQIRSSIYKLYDKNKKSRILNKCLSLILSLGYRKEVSECIRDIEFFDVLIEKISENVMKVIFSSNIESVAALEDLKKQCFLSENSYLFTIDLLCNMEEQLKSLSLSDVSHSIKVGADRSVLLLPKIIRIRQELEKHKVWSKIIENQRNEQLGAVYCAYRILATSSSSLNIDSTAASSNNSVSVPTPLEWISSDPTKLPIFRKSPQEIAKLYRLVHKIPETVSSCEFQVDMVDWALKYIDILQNHQVANLFIDTLVTQKYESSLPFEHMCRLLSIGSAYNEHYRSTLTGLVSSNINSEMQADTNTEDEYRSFVELVLTSSIALNNTVSLCKELKDHAVGAIDTNNVSAKLPGLLKYILPSICALRWIETCIDDKLGFMSGNTRFMNLSQVFFQIIVIAIDNFPVHHVSCFNILKKIFKMYRVVELAETTSAGAVAQQLSQNSRVVMDSIECIVFLMGSGYSIVPAEFIIAEKKDMDAAAFRHFMELIIRNISPPFSLEFTKKMVELLSDYKGLSIIKANPLLKNNLIIILQSILSTKALGEVAVSKMRELQNQLLI
jgi:hypothetical protein